jgi:hypothetical protein
MVTSVADAVYDCGISKLEKMSMNLNKIRERVVVL